MSPGRFLACQHQNPRRHPEGPSLVPPRHRIPTPAWAELPPADSNGADAFQAFMSGLLNGRLATPPGMASFDSGSDARSVMVDEDQDAPQLGLF